MLESFKQVLTTMDDKFYQKKFLLAVSGGVDSMVLLTLFLSLPANLRPALDVVHVNHHLRLESDEEEKFVREYCANHGIRCHSKAWLEGKTHPTNLEARARDMRYAFFTKIAQEQKCDYVVTAHHGDDQAETILMRLVKGVQFRNVGGIKLVTRRASGITLFRPLLVFSKEELYQFAEAHQIPFKEDHTNQLATYTRNRYRLQLIPSLKKENPNLLEHLQNFSRQVGYANDLIESVVQPLLAEIVVSKEATCWQLDVTKFLSQSEAIRYFVLVDIMQQALVKKGVLVNEHQIIAMLSLLTSHKGQGEIHLAANWVLEKRYEQAFLRLTDPAKQSENKKEMYHLSAGECFFLSENEWVTIVGHNDPVPVPKECCQWKKWELAIGEAQGNFPIVIERRRPGDKMIYNAQGQRKKIKRVLIDQKVPKEVREKIWIVRDAQHEILGIIPIKKSYLSIIKETDKIHYRLIYLKDER